MISEAKRAYKKAYQRATQDAVWGHLHRRSCKNCGRQIGETGEKRGVFLRDGETVYPSAIISAGHSWRTIDSILAPLQVQCRFCYRKERGQTPRMYRARARKRLNAEAQSLKVASGGCPFCGEKEPVALDFHHRDPDVKDGSVRRQTSLKRVQAEAAKCVVLCANCHRKVHAGLLQVWKAAMGP